MSRGAGLPEGLLRRMGLDPGERRPALLMATLVGTLLCAYTIAKILRDSLFLSYFGPLDLPYAYVAVAIASVIFVWLEHRLGRRLPFGPTRYTQFLAIAFAVTAPLIWHRARLFTAGAFYVWTGSQAMMLLPHFWVLALDLWDTRRARRVFPVLAGFGLLGGLAGGAIARWFTTWGTTGLMWTLASLLVVALGLSRVAERDRRSRARNTPSPAPGTSSWSLFRRSRYLQLLVAVLTLSVIVATLVDFQFKFLIQRLYPEPHAMTRFLGAFYLGLNLLALIFQFGAAGWLLERLNLGLSSTLQPVTLLGFATLAALSNGGWAVIALRWVQGIVQQGLGKSSTEIYFGAIRPQDRRRIKPAVDTLVERWSDALVGVLLIVALRLLHVSITLIGIGTAVLCASWIGLMFALNRQYGRAFEEALSRRWIGPDDAPETLRSPLARRALMRAMRDGEPEHIALALRLARNVRGPQVKRAVREGLDHPAAVVRVAALDALEVMQLDDRDRRVEAALDDPSDDVRRAAVRFLVSRRRLEGRLAQRLLDVDPVLRLFAVEALLDRPARALDLLTPEWIEARIATGRTEDLLAAARALAVHSGPFADGALRRLLAHSEPEIRRAALESAARRPHPQLLTELLPLLEVPDLAFAARRAVAANGDAAVNALRDRLGTPRRRALAAQTLAQIATPRAISALLPLARSTDAASRYVGLEALMRARMVVGRPVLGRALAHRFFLREVHDYEEAALPAVGLARSKAPELRLLGDSWGEIADRALDRAFWALACTYEPRPLFGAFSRIKARDAVAAAPALEYLGHLLPRGVFRAVGRIFDPAALPKPLPGAVHDWVVAAWNSEDPWLRACAVRASTVVPDFDTRLFVAQESGDPHVREEIEWLLHRGPVAPARAREATGC